MLAYAIRRLIMAIPTLLIVLTIVFFMIRVAPGDPARAMLGDYASERAVQALRENMGLNKPLWEQYFEFLGGLLKGDFGRSMITGFPVGEQIKRALPYTLELTLAGILIGILIGVPLGILTALRRNQLPDYIGRILSLMGISFPSFYLGIWLILIFSVMLNWFPAIGGTQFTSWSDHLRHLVLPAATLGLIMVSHVSRLTRSSVLNVLGENYVQTARAKGLSERTVIYKHVLRNALIPIISVIGIYAIVLTGGSLVVETVFSRPGLGKLIMGALLQRDYITIQSVIVVYSIFVVFVNLLTDISYALANPTIRYR